MKERIKIKRYARHRDEMEEEKKLKFFSIHTDSIYIYEKQNIEYSRLLG